jgi:hypothetical protein
MKFGREARRPEKQAGARSGSLLWSHEVPDDLTGMQMPPRRAGSRRLHVQVVDVLHDRPLAHKNGWWFFPNLIIRMQRNVITFKYKVSLCKKSNSSTS